MNKFKFLPPYKTNGKTNFPETQKKAGCYIIKENDKIVYVGMSGYNIYKTLYRHFENWNHKQQIVITYKNKMKRNRYTVRVITCTPAQAARLEKLLILKHNPRDNDLKYKGYQLTAFDEKIYKTYEETTVINDCPF